MLNLKFKKTIFLSSFLALTTTVAVVSVACASVPSAQDYSDKKVNIIESNTPYETIHNLEFSFDFNNSGGIQYMLDADGLKTGTYINIPESQPYSVFGTGWLFDWKLNSEKPDNNGNINWTGYFATNLHVADALLNPQDNKDYQPSWLAADSIVKQDIADHTNSFYLGKYDNSNGPLSSTNKKTNLTYVKIGENKNGTNNLPKTQFAATNFVDPFIKIPGLDPKSKTANNFQPYVDFAVLAIEINYVKNPNPLSIDQIGENNVWTEWILPAMKTLQSFYPQNKTNPNLTYQEIFSATDLTLSNPNVGNIYIGGYPYLNSVVAPYTNIENKLNNGLIGSPVWTINVDKNSNTNTGQPIKLNNGVDSIYNKPKWIYNPIPNRNFMLTYHGQSFKQYGIDYVVTDSNLAAGSSGSMALESNNKLLGIYYGTLTNQSGQESSIGLLQPLIISKNSELGFFYSKPYDLIGWSSANKDIISQNKSYFTSLEDGSATYLFSNSVTS